MEPPVPSTVRGHTGIAVTSVMGVGGPSGRADVFGTSREHGIPDNRNNACYFLMFFKKVTTRQKHCNARTMKTIFLIVIAITLFAYMCLSSRDSFSRARILSVSGERSPTHFHASICERSPIIRRLINWSVGRWLNIEDDDERWWRLSDLAEVWKPFFIHLDPIVLVSNDENKYFAKFLDPTDDCNVLTLGIGHHIESERALMRKYHHCRYLAIDPEENVNRRLVEEVNGRYLKGAIGARMGEYEGFFGMNGKYGINKMMHIGFSNFTQDKEYNDNRLIDLLVVDVEGAEFGLIKLLQEDAKRLPSICQFNMELHAPPKKYGNMTIAEFTTMFTTFLLDSPFILMNVDRFDDLQFHRLFFLNIHDNECIRKFVRCT